MHFRVVSHACLEVTASSKRLVIDPWLVGSVYWGSWWHCPGAYPSDDVYSSDYIYITHWHFDHFHHESLARFDKKKCRVLVPKFPVSGLVEQLKGIGFENITEIRHAEPFELGPGFRLTSYQIGFEDDSVAVVEADGKVLIDLNDTKPFPSTWKLMKRRYPRVDFMLRSHSAAWSYPSRYRLNAPADALPMSRSTYMEAFRRAAEILAPRHAIPFASGVCHLHPEVLEENKYLVSSVDLARYWEPRKLNGTELSLMPHGSTWSDTKGFTINHAALYETVEQHVPRLLTEHATELAGLSAREADKKLTFDLFEGAFAKMARAFFLIRPFLKVKWDFVIRRQPEAKPEFWRVDFGTGRVSRSSQELPDYTAQIEVSPSVLADALENRIFKNIDISKRWSVTVNPGGVARHLAMLTLVTVYEGGYFTPRNLLRSRFVSGMWRRRFEVLDYARFGLSLLAKGRAALIETVTGS